MVRIKSTLCHSLEIFNFIRTVVSNALFRTVAPCEIKFLDLDDNF